MIAKVSHPDRYCISEVALLVVEAGKWKVAELISRVLSKARHFDLSIGQRGAERGSDVILSDELGRRSDRPGALLSESIIEAIQELALLEFVVSSCFKLDGFLFVLEQVDAGWVQVAHCVIKLTVITREALLVTQAILKVHSAAIVRPAVAHWRIGTVHFHSVNLYVCVRLNGSQVRNGHEVGRVGQVHPRLNIWQVRKADFDVRAWGALDRGSLVPCTGYIARRGTGQVE